MIARFGLLLVQVKISYEKSDESGKKVYKNKVKQVKSVFDNE